MKLQSAHVLVGASLLASALVFACAESAEDIPGEGNESGANGGTKTENSQTLPPSNPAGGSTSGGSTSSSGGSTSTSSGSTTSSSGSTTSSSGGTSSGSSGSVPACSWAGDFTKMISKMAEIQAGAPCDSTCDPATHCCFDLAGGLGSSGGASGGLPLDAGTSSGGGGLPTGGGGTCVSNN